MPVDLLSVRDLAERPDESLFANWIHIRKDPDSRFAQYRDKLFQLLKIPLALKQHCLAEHFSQYAANRPNINSLSISIVADEYFRRPIRPGRNIIRKLIGLCFLPRQVHISNLDLTLLIYQYILRFHVTMDDISRMHEVNRIEQLVQDELDHWLDNCYLTRMNQSLQVVLHVLHAQINLVKMLRIGDTHHPFQSDNIPMTQEL